MGDESVVDNPRAEAILAAASTLVRTFTGRVWVDVDDEPDSDEPSYELEFDAAQTVVLIVSQRVYLNPSGTTQETTGPFSRSVAAWSAMGLALSDDEKEMLGGGQPDAIPGLSSIRVVAPAGTKASRTPHRDCGSSYFCI